MADFDNMLDDLHTRLAGLSGFSSKTLIPNPYSIADNPEQFVRDGYGVIVSDSSQGLNDYKSTFDDQSMEILLSTEFRTTDSNPTPVQNVAKSLKADALTVRNSLLGTLLSGVAKVDYIGTSGIVFESDYVWLTVNFNFTIIEEIV